jgi:3-deoxy-D-manno-octulosonic-acid transferase
MKKKGVTSYLVDATMKPGSPRKFPIVKNFHKVLFKDISKILTVSQVDSIGFKSFDCNENQLMVVGDTRFDRVYQRSLLARNRNLIKDEVLKNKKILVAGSTWGVDEDVIIPAFIKLAKFDPDVLLIIAPHEPTLIHLDRIENEFSRHLKTIRFSHLNNYNDERVIIIDSIGILLTLYTYADAAFIGGSFKQNIHNVLEAAVYGIPVLFGPKIENSQETQKLLKRGGGILIMDKRDAYKELRLLFKDDELRKGKGKLSYDFVKENLGATEKILKEIYKVI